MDREKYRYFRIEVENPEVLEQIRYIQEHLDEYKIRWSNPEEQRKECAKKRAKFYHLFKRELDRTYNEVVKVFKSMDTTDPDVLYTLREIIRKKHLFLWRHICCTYAVYKASNLNWELAETILKNVFTDYLNDFTLNIMDGDSSVEIEEGEKSIIIKGDSSYFSDYFWIATLTNLEGVNWNPYFIIISDIENGEENILTLP